MAWWTALDPPQAPRPVRDKGKPQPGRASRLRADPCPREPDNPSDPPGRQPTAPTSRQCERVCPGRRLGGIGRGAADAISDSLARGDQASRAPVDHGLMSRVVHLGGTGDQPVAPVMAPFKAVLREDRHRSPAPGAERLRFPARGRIAGHVERLDRVDRGIECRRRVAGQKISAKVFCSAVSAPSRSIRSCGLTCATYLVTSARVPGQVRQCPETTGLIAPAPRNPPSLRPACAVRVRKPGLPAQRLRGPQAISPPDRLPHPATPQHHQTQQRNQTP